MLEFSDAVVPLDAATQKNVKYLPGEEMLLSAADKCSVFVRFDGSPVPKPRIEWRHRAEVIGACVSGGGGGGNAGAVAVVVAVAVAVICARLWESGIVSHPHHRTPKTARTLLPRFPLQSSRLLLLVLGGGAVVSEACGCTAPSLFVACCCCFCLLCLGHRGTMAPPPHRTAGVVC